MTVTIKKLLVGATVAASISGLGATPVFATNLVKPTDIQFTTNGVKNTDANKPNINTWTYGAAVSDSTGIGGVNRRVLNDYANKGNTNKAIAALTDNDSATNVELFTDGEVVKDHVGFTANFGKNTLKVESVTKDDWADGTLATAWLKGFGNAYGGLMSKVPTTANSNLLQDFNSNFDSLVSTLKTTGFNSAGDANIGDVTLNKKTGELKVDLVGHLDVAGKYVDTRRTVLDTRTTIKDPQKTILDTRVTIVDTRKTITDTRPTILDTRPTIVSNKKTIPNPTFNQQITNPTFNKQITNPTLNQQIANPTLNQQIANPTYNKDIPNPTYNKQIANSNYLGSSPDKARNSTGNAIFDAMLFNLAKTAFLTNTPFQISEIAKITFNNQVDYAFGFSAIDSGAIAGDRNKTNDQTSHTGIYSWSQTYTVVPEPSGLFGLVTVGSLVMASRRKSRKTT